MESNHLNKTISIIQEKLNANGGKVSIPLKNGRGSFTVKLMPGGVEVSNLNTAPFLPWAVFAAAVELLIHKGGSAKKGNAMHFKLNEDGLPIDSIEGYIAAKVFNKKPGDWVFRRITPVALILDWAGICENGHGELKLAISPKECADFDPSMSEDISVDKPINGKSIKPKAADCKKTSYPSKWRQIYKDEYINSEAVLGFTDWIGPLLDKKGAFIHGYIDQQSKTKWQCDSIYSAYDQYRWNFSISDPKDNTSISGSSFQETVVIFNKLSELLSKSIKENDSASCLNYSTRILEWGKVTNKNVQALHDINDQEGSLCSYLLKVKDVLEKPLLDLEECTFIRMNSGFTKIYSLYITDFIMYDGRVGAALGLLSRMFCEAKGFKHIPGELCFAWGPGRQSKHYAKKDNRRNPTKGLYKFPDFTGKPLLQLQCNVKASWLLKQVLNKTYSRFNQLSPDERLFALANALFMIGYDVK